MAFKNIFLMLFLFPCSWAVVLAQRPNIVLIISDDQAWTDFGFMGHGVIATPHLDRLAAESAVFPNGYVPTSLCRASLATLLTGLYAHQHRICTNDPPDGMARESMLTFIQQVPTLPRLLSQAGYRSLQTGKFWEGHYSNADFTEGMTTDGRHGGPGLDIGRKTMKPIFDFIDSAGETPFFIWYAPMMPHQPHNPPERILQKYRMEGRHEKIAKYFAMCEWFDETVGELLGYIDGKGLGEKTLVVFVVDNGWIQETSPVKTTRGGFAPKSKLSPYDGGLRTPVLLRWPGRIPPQRYSDLVSTIDLVPTLLAACGLEKTEEMQGLNLLEVATGQKERLDREAVYGEIYLHTARDVNHPALNLTHRWMRKGDWKLILAMEEGATPEVYNVISDPFEQNNLARADSETLHWLHTQWQSLRQTLDTWWPGK